MDTLIAGAWILLGCVIAISVTLIKRIIEMGREPEKPDAQIFNHCVSLVIANNLRARMYCSGWCDG